MTIFHKVLFAILIGWVQCAVAEESPVIPVGEFSNMRATKSGHCYGYSADFWRYDRTIVGFLYHSEGLCGDSPTGLLEDVNYEPKTGKLSFKAKVSMGCNFNEKKKCVPVIDLVEFNGKLAKTQLVGTMTWREIGKKKSLKKENVQLKPEAENSMTSYSSLSEWKSDLKEVFSRLPIE